MPKHIIVKQKYRQLIMLWNIIFGIFLVLSACGDLVKESKTGACNNAIDNRNYDEALSVCTSRKDKASAYMGKAGYDIVNLLKAPGSSPGPHTAPSDVSLGLDDASPASILNILQLSVAVIADKDTRATAISSSRTNLDNAYKLLQPYLNDNSSPLSTDEILLNTFAISFAMQLDQIMLFDNKTTSSSTVPIPDSDGDLKCTQVSGYNIDSAKALLIPMDGHIWAAERDGMQCARVLNAYNATDNKTGAADNLTKWVNNTKGGDNDSKLPEPFYDAVCPSFESLAEYLIDLAANIKELSLSGDNTKSITDADNSTNELMNTIGCFK